MLLKCKFFVKCVSLLKKKEKKSKLLLLFQCLKSENWEQTRDLGPRWPGEPSKGPAMRTEAMPSTGLPAAMMINKPEVIAWLAPAANYLILRNLLCIWSAKRLWFLNKEKTIISKVWETPGTQNHHTRHTLATCVRKLDPQPDTHRLESRPRITCFVLTTICPENCGRWSTWRTQHHNWSPDVPNKC